MRTLATGNFNRSRLFLAGSACKPAHLGFTLLELMVVATVVAIVLTFALLNRGVARSQLLEDTAGQLAATVSLVEQESILRRQVMGIRFDRNGYRVVRFDTRWSAPDSDRLYRRRYLPVGVEIRSGTGGRFRDPHFVMFPDGETVISELVLKDEDGLTLTLSLQHGNLTIGEIPR